MTQTTVTIAKPPRPDPFPILFAPPGMTVIDCDRVWVVVEHHVGEKSNKTLVVCLSPPNVFTVDSQRKVIRCTLQIIATPRESGL
jgi:hypothetical protein